ncbi:hypothetical protein ES705_40290 [subsurface metagenome]
MRCKPLPENERFRIGGMKITKIYILDDDRRYWDANELRNSKPRPNEVLRMDPGLERLLTTNTFAILTVIIIHIIIWLT